eukprot:7904159-Prorocentrum_lima.AAC.1
MQRTTLSRASPGGRGPINPRKGLAHEAHVSVSQGARSNLSVSESAAGSESESALPGSVEESDPMSAPASTPAPVATSKP